MRPGRLLPLRWARGRGHGLLRHRLQKSSFLGSQPVRGISQPSSPGECQNPTQSPTKMLTPLQQDWVRRSRGTHGACRFPGPVW